MKETLRAVFLVLLLAVVAAIVVPIGLLGMRLANSWTASNTDQLLGGGLTCLGMMAAILAAFIGAGAFAKLAGWRAPRRDETPAPVEATAYRQLPEPSPIPPWGVTGGGDFRLLPPPADAGERRYYFDAEQMGRDGKE